MKKFLISITLHFFAMMPLRLNHLIGSWIGLLLFYLKGKPWKVSRTNIQICFPEMTPIEQEALLKNSLIELGKQ